MKFGLSIIIIILLAAVFAPYLSTYPPSLMNLAEKLQAPSSRHLLGTDGNGADLYTSLLYGARLSLRIAFVVVFISTFVGLIYGSLAGYYGGLLDLFFMRFIDMLSAFPGFLLALAIIAFLGPSVNHLILALCVTGWTSYARLVKGEVQNIKTKEYISAAQALGATDLRVVVLHCWPNLLGLVIVQMTFGFAGTIISEAGLSFLGLGASPREASWGALLGTGRKYLMEAPQVSLFPGLAIMLLVLSLNLIGEDLRRRFG